MKTKNGFVLRSLGKEYILAAETLETADFNSLISMNETAAFLWKEVEGKDFDATMLADLLVNEYGISRDVAANDVSLLLQNWEKAGVIF